MTHELLGEVRCPSGTLLVVDIGLLGMWKHTEPPLLDDWEAPPETVAVANHAVDYRVEGPDAAVAGRLFGQAAGWLYDRSPDFVAAFEAEARARGLDARLVAAPARVPHRRRVEHALSNPSRVGVVEFHGISAPCIGGLPTDRSMKLFGTRVGAGVFGDCWQHLELQVKSGVCARTELVGEALVDTARLGFADVEMLGEWKHDEPLDGRADFLFWGADAESFAQIHGVPRVGDDQFGWLDLPAEEVVEHGMRIEHLRDAEGRRFATDFRPHSHHYQLMAQLRTSITESGTVEIGDAQLCAFMTSWGDGVFPVEVDREETGAILTVRVVLGTDRTLRNLRSVNRE